MAKIRAIVLCGFLALVFVQTNTTFVLVAKQVQTNVIMEAPYIGKVRKLFYPDGRETKWFVPIIETEIAEGRSLNVHLLRQGKIRSYLGWLRTEPDPDVRRHYLYEIGYAFGDEAYLAVNNLISMLHAEPEERVRIEYISSLFSLAINAGLADSTILRILGVMLEEMEEDPSWCVKVYAACTLSWFGEEHGIAVIKQVIEENIYIPSPTLYCIPGALQRMNNDQSIELLIQIEMHSRDDKLAIQANWTLYHLGLVTEERVIETAEWFGKNSTAVKARIAAISVLGAMAKANPILKDAIERILDNIMHDEQEDIVIRHVMTTMQQLEE